MLLRLLVLAALVSSALGCGSDAPLVRLPPDGTGSLMIRAVRVFDARRGILADGMADVLVRDGRIAAVGACGLDAGGVPELAGNGGTLLPGLVDMHAHTGSSSNPPGASASLPDLDDTLASFLYAGVTTLLDLGNLTPAVFDQRDEIGRGERLGPRMFAAGPVFTARDGHPAGLLRKWLPWYLKWYVLPRATREVTTAEDARRAVGELLDLGPNILKITLDAGAPGDVPMLSGETMAAIIAAGHQHGIRSIVHIGDSAEALQAVAAGADALAHAPWRDEISERAVAALAEKAIPVVATVAVWDVAGRPRKTIDDFLAIEREVAPASLLESLLSTPPLEDAATRTFMEKVSAAWDVRRRNVAKMMAAGVTILAGSDSPNPGSIAGAGLHLELRKLVEAGMTPGQALRAATWDAARFLAGREADFGEVAIGKRADLVIVDGDPTQRIADTERITHVLLGGIALERSARQGR